MLERGYGPGELQRTLVECTQWAEDKVEGLSEGYVDLYPWRVQHDQESD